MKTKYLFFIYFFMLVLTMQSQTNYMTKKGHLKMITRVDNQAVILESNELYIYLDYTTKQMHGTLDLKSLINDIPELNSYLNAVEEPLLVNFSGIIPADDFMSQPHQPLTFDWQVHITFQNKSFEIVFESTLEHAEQGYMFSCRLSTFGEIEVSNLGLKNLIPGLDNKIGIQIVQTILRDY
jgi:hypothetical protein